MRTFGHYSIASIGRFWLKQKGNYEKSIKNFPSPISVGEANEVFNQAVTDKLSDKVTCGVVTIKAKDCHYTRAEIAK